MLWLSRQFQRPHAFVYQYSRPRNIPKSRIRITIIKVTRRLVVLVSAEPGDVAGQQHERRD